MVQHIHLQAEKRDVEGKKARHLLKEGVVPGIVYGHGFENIPVSLEYKVFHKAFSQAGYNSIITLAINGETYDVLVHDVVYDPVTDAYAHIDFLRIKKGEKIETVIPVIVTGECSLVKDMGGLLLHELDEVKVRCLPQDLIHDTQIDISLIEGFNQPIRVKDLKLPASLEILSDPEGVVLTVVPPRKEEEVTETVADAIPADLKAEQEAAAAAKVDPEKEKKKEEKK